MAANDEFDNESPPILTSLASASLAFTSLTLKFFTYSIGNQANWDVVGRANQSWSKPEEDLKLPTFNECFLRLPDESRRSSIPLLDDINKQNRRKN